MLQHKPIQTIHMLSLSHFRALWCVVAILCSAAMWSVDDICKELADIAQLIAGKKSDDPFCQALIQTSCSKIKGLVVLAPCDALKIKKAAMVLGDDFTNAIWACLEKRLTSVGSELGTPQGPQGMSVCTKPQTLLHPFNYMTAADWKELEHQETSWARKQTIVALRLKLLGIVSMSEKTMKSCLALLACTLTVVPDEKMMYSMLQEFKATFASTSCAVQFSNLTMYPENASDLPQNVFQAAFGSEQPCPKVIDKFNLVARKVILRNTSKHMRGTGGKCADQHQASAGSSLSHGMGMNDMMSNPMLHMFNMMCNKLMGMNSPGDVHGHSQNQQGKGGQVTLHNFKPKTLLALGDVPGPDPANTESKLALPCPAPETEQAAATPVPSTQTQKGESHEELAEHDSEPDYEQAAFDALKARNAFQKVAKTKGKGKGKAKAKAKTKPHAKAKAKAATTKRSSTSSSSSAKKMKKLDYKVPPPSEAQLQSTPRNYYNKHYHKCKELAINCGYSDTEAKEFAKKARATAVELWDKQLS